MLNREAFENFKFESFQKGLDISAIKAFPHSEAKAVLVILHGMAEHIGRYTDVFEGFLNLGYAIYANDHIGHGKSVNEQYFKGYFGEENRDGNVFVEDTKKLCEIARDENPGKKVIIIGHSMGSFIARCFAVKYPKLISAAVFCSTTGPQPPIGIGIAISEMLIKIKGGKSKTRFLKHMITAGYNSKTEKRTPVDWLNRDEKAVDEYISDPGCGYTYTIMGYRDMLTMTKACTSNHWLENINKDLPILFISGTMDPIGNYSKGVMKTVARLERLGANLKVKIYEGPRHELLKELNKSEVHKYISDWIEDAVRS